MNDESWIHCCTRASPLQFKANKRLIKSKIITNKRMYGPDFEAKLYYNRKIVASCLIFLERKNNFYLSCFGTNPHYRRQGLGKILMANIIKFAKKKKINTIHLTSTRQGRGLYLKFGFIPENRKPVTHMSLDLK